MLVSSTLLLRLCGSSSHLGKALHPRCLQLRLISVGCLQRLLHLLADLLQKVA